ncbi:hypothetical protein [Blautia difficilis]|uniref:Uncharacterized protein n=1 Tax=Blautia difficilis TaxID=2763027 RepID=A0ABR7ILR3_9FIRM|nr:hypothetical protein [Blautia difficilis]MBC5780875.1 hypothetical protein [Blautia difficilis]
MLINKIVSSILQTILFGIIPVAWWFVTVRKHQKFAEWIGLKKVQGGKKTLIGIIVVSIVFIVSGALTLYTIRDIETANANGSIIPSWIIHTISNLFSGIYAAFSII